MVPNFAVVFIISVFMFELFYRNVVDFCLFIQFLLFICQWYCFLLFKVNYLYCVCIMKHSQNFFMQYSPLHTSCWFSIPSHVHIVDTEYPQEICSPTFVVDDLSKLLFHPYIFLIKDSRSTYGVWSDFQYWLNSNVLVSSEDITTTQNSLLSHTFLRDSNLFFVMSEWR